MKEVLKSLVPRWLLELRRKALIGTMRKSFCRLSLQETFSRIYRDKLWGEDLSSPWFSGSGSIGGAREAYQEFVRCFIKQRGITSVVDLGCGDFRIGAPIARLVNRYVGVDIVPDLIDYLQARFGSSTTEFRCLDIVNDDLPEGELCLVRQVLQHLSNGEIKAVLPKLARYKYVLITEHYPAPGRLVLPNRDKPHGPDIRVADDSAVFLDQPPFGLSVREVLRVEADSFQVTAGETIRTLLMSRPSSAFGTCFSSATTYPWAIEREEPSFAASIQESTPERFPDGFLTPKRERG